MEVIVQEQLLDAAIDDEIGQEHVVVYHRLDATRCRERRPDDAGQLRATGGTGASSLLRGVCS